MLELVCVALEMQWTFMLVQTASNILLSSRPALFWCKLCCDPMSPGAQGKQLHLMCCSWSAWSKAKLSPKTVWEHYIARKHFFPHLVPLEVFRLGGIFVSGSDSNGCTCAAALTADVNNGKGFWAQEVTLSTGCTLLMCVTLTKYTPGLSGSESACPTAGFRNSNQAVNM